MFVTRVLGIDPGLTRCGYAVIDGRGPSTVRAVSMGVIRTPASDPLPNRLATLRTEFTSLIAEFEPDVVAVEQVFFQVNVRTAMATGQASGLALAEAAIAGCEVIQYTPNQVKDAVAGWGGADKEQVQKMVQARLKLSTLPKPADAADAAAIALTHLSMSPIGRQLRQVGIAMIGSLRGEVLDRELDGTALVEVAGVGYQVHVTERTLAELEPGTETFLYVHHHVTETAESLFGFRAKDERITFQHLIKTNGVGPTLAMSVLATHPPAALVDIVANNDVAALTLVSGVGKKTAERLLVELRDRLSLPMLDASPPSGRLGGGRRARGAHRARVRHRRDPRRAP